jgi:hypothetical protein
MALRLAGTRRVASALAAGALLLGDVTQQAGALRLRSGGLADLPLIIGTGETDTGFYSPGANEIDMVAAGGSRHRVNGGGSVATGAFTATNPVLINNTLAGRVVAPAAIGANQNDYAGHSDAVVALLSSTGIFNFTGFTGGVVGRLLIVINSGASQFNLMHQDVLSAAANRMITDTGAGVAVGVGGIALLVYDANASRWRVSVT